MWFNKKSSKDKKQLFTQEWIDEWKSSINSSRNYKKKSKGWNAPIVLKFEPAPEILQDRESIGFFLDLGYGKCQDLRYATEKDLSVSDIVLTADHATWLKILENKKDPTMMIMKGELELEKGSVVMLSLRKQAAKALLDTAPVYTDAGSNKYSSPDTENIIRKNNSHTSFKTTNEGLDFESFPMKLFQKAKIYGVWNPAEIDFTIDKQQWEQLKTNEQEIIIHLSALFIAGEEAVTLDLLPLIQVIAKEGRLEEEMFLTSFLWEEAKHTEFFARFLKEVIGDRPDFSSYHGPFYKKLFYEKLPSALNLLHTDTSSYSQLKASGTYNMIIEGVLAETGYQAYYNMLNENNLLPGLKEGITKLKQDESRHIAYGLYLINRLLDENPDLREPFENELESLLDDATNVIHELFEPYDLVPFGLEKEWFLNYAIKQFQHRLNKIGF